MSEPMTGRVNNTTTAELSKDPTTQPLLGTAGYAAGTELSPAERKAGVNLGYLGALIVTMAMGMFQFGKHHK